MRYLYLLSLFIFCTKQAQSQSFDNFSKEEKWVLLPKLKQDNHCEAALNFQFSEIDISETEKVVTLEKKDKYALAKINDKGQIKWFIELKGRPVFLGKFEEKVFFIEMTQEVKKATLKISFLNSINGKSLQEANLNYESEYISDLIVLFNSFSKNYHIGFRASSFHSPKSYPLYFTSYCTGLEGLSSTAYIYYSISKNLDISPQKSANIPLSNFAGCDIDKDGNLLWLSIDNYGIARADKLELNTGKIVSTLKSPLLEAKKIERINTVSKLSNSGDAIFLAADYSYQIKTVNLNIIKFDFKSTTVKNYAQVFDKKYNKKLADEYVPVPGFTEKPTESSWDDLKTNQLIESETDLIVLMESQFREPSMTYDKITYAATVDVLIKFIDVQKWELKSCQIIPKQFILGTELGIKSFGKIHNGSLYVIAPTKLRMTEVGVVYSQINLGTRKAEKMEILSRDGLKKYENIEPSSCLWFKDYLLAPYYMGTNVKKGKIYQQLFVTKY